MEQLLVSVCHVVLVQLVIIIMAPAVHPRRLRVYPAHPWLAVLTRDPCLVRPLVARFVPLATMVIFGTVPLVNCAVLRPTVMNLGAMQRTKFVTNVHLVGEARAWSLLLRTQHHVRPVFLEPPGMMDFSLIVNCVTPAVLWVFFFNYATECASTTVSPCVACTMVTGCDWPQTYCTTTTDQYCVNNCLDYYYLSNGQCLSCSTCSVGYYLSTPCTYARDAVCTVCTANVANCISYNCTVSTDSMCLACSAGYYLSGGSCAACSTNIANCASYTCSNSANQVCTGCNTGYYLNGQICSLCTAITGCLPGYLTCSVAGHSWCSQCSSLYTTTAVGTCMRNGVTGVSTGNCHPCV